MGGVRKAKLGRKRKGQMLESSRVPTRTQTKGSRRTACCVLPTAAAAASSVAHGPCVRVALRV